MRLIATGSEDNSVKIWDAEIKKLSSRYCDHLSGVKDIKFSPDGTCIASCGSDSKINIRDIRCKKLIQHYESYEYELNNIDFHPSGYYLLSGGSEIKIWDLRIGRLAYQINGHNGQCKAVKFSKSGEYFASGGADNLVMIWNSNFCNTQGVGLENIEDKFTEEIGKFKSNTRTQPKSKRRKIKRKQKTLEGVQGIGHDVNNLATEIMPQGFKKRP